MISLDIEEMAQFISAVFNDYIMSKIVVYVTALSVFSYDKNEISSDEELSADESGTGEKAHTGDLDGMQGYVFVYAITYVLESISKYVINASEEVPGIRFLNRERAPTEVDIGVNHDDSLNDKKIPNISKSIDLMTNNGDDKKFKLINNDNSNDKDNDTDSDNNNINSNNKNNNKNSVHNNGNLDREVKKRSKEMMILNLCFLPLHSLSSIMMILLDFMDEKMKKKLLDIMQNKIFEILFHENEIQFADTNTFSLNLPTYMCIIGKSITQR